MSVTLAILRQRAWRLWMIWLNFFVSSLWAYAMVCSLILWLGFSLVGLSNPFASPIPEWWGTILTCTYMLQATIGLALDRRYEPGTLRYLLWIIWYPLAFWLIQTLSAVTGIIKAVTRSRQTRGTWISPDRGLR